MKQQSLLKPQRSDHGGSLKHPQKRRRPLSTSQSMHIVLRSSKARGKFSFKKYQKSIDQILMTFANKYYVQILSYANVGNHIHLHIKLFKRKFYAPFIRAVTAAIMIKVTGFSKWNKKPEGFRFWDHRPFSRIASGFKAFLHLTDYIQINKEEAKGLSREQARHNVFLKRLKPT